MRRKSEYLIVLYFSIRYCYEGYRLGLDFFTDFFDVQDFTMDGEDLMPMILPLMYALYSIILTRFTSLITIALYNGIWVVCALLLILVPAKKKLRKNDTLGGMNHE